MRLRADVLGKREGRQMKIKKIREVNSGFGNNAEPLPQDVMTKIYGKIVINKAKPDKLEALGKAPFLMRFFESNGTNLLYNLTKFHPNSCHRSFPKSL